MKIDMILVFAIVVGLVAVPYALFILFGSGNSKKIEKQIKEEAKKNNLNINHSEKWSSRYLSLDTVANKLLFSKTRGEELEHQHIDLNTITRIVTLEDRTSKRIDGKMHDTLEKLSLEFISKENAQPIVINFYDSTLDATQNYEMNRVNKWKELIEKQLKLSAKHSKAA
ncbi:hypothetical protein [Leeuwenhoekiella sp. LLG6367-2.1]|uniref:hypothetical protein n=1 Tax=Leeuwenhoekiella sp. LLG6367-2.1 TaxID=3160833 RepID=UPI0038698E3B